MAELFAQRGARVLLVDRSLERAELTLQRIREFGGEAQVHVADVSDPNGAEAAVSSAVRCFGGVDVLVNNAGIAMGGAIDDLTIEDWHRVLAVNLTGPMLMTRAALALLRATSGAVVNIASVGGMRGLGNASYAASKGGLIALTRDLAYSLGSHGIRVNCVAPGHIHTPMGDTGDDNLRDLRRRAGLLGIEGTAWDVAWAALFLASDAARWITGVCLPVDAGTTAAMPLVMMQRLMLDRAAVNRDDRQSRE
jgi:NAD(P)-dependent dehydrogenase (short-subunit alcohol dehydrogenase family)